MNRIPLLLLLLLCILSCKEEKPVSKHSAVIDLTELTIAEIHENYKNGTYDIEALTSAYLERIKAKDSLINSITYINPNALDVAKKLDEEFKSTGKLRPLHGIPMIVKDNFNTKGMPTTGGSLALKDFVPDNNATMVQQLMDAGAIIIAKSNMAEWAFSPMHTTSSTHGTTKNPYNTNYVPAGSSGGTGASIAANFGVIGLGTDTGNSIRGPASHNALVGFRSTMGLTSRAGIIPLYLRNDIAGPMCRTVEDATRTLNLISGLDPKDSITFYAKGKQETDYMRYLDTNGLKNARIGVLRELSDDNPDSEITSLFNRAILDIGKLGATVIDSLIIPDFDSLRRNQWCNTFRQDIESYLAEYVKNDTLSTLEDIIRLGPAETFVSERLVRNRDAKNGRNGIPCGNTYTDVLNIAFREAIETTMDELELDAIIYPSWNNRPATIANFQEEYRGDNSQIIAPHTGQPGFTVPMGFTSGNLPAGLQFLGRMYSEPTLIRLTYAYEQGTEHRKKPNL
ncbi:amidase [Maribacter aestuarii]|uniref:amidase n=1 Tax=Maribacter aestuarii TaxID=1130723 RepID=UPI00248B9424|nr:amidase [Maribacter aestuarii]